MADGEAEPSCTACTARGGGTSWSPVSSPGSRSSGAALLRGHVLTWSRRVPIAVVLAGFLVVRALRRAVIVSPFGLEARRTFTTWRVPWSAVESFAVGPSRSRQSAGALTVVLIDGSTRSARWGPSPRRAGLRRGGGRGATPPRVRPRGYLGPNRPLMVFVLGGIALLVACAVADIGRKEHRYQAGRLSTTAKELRDLKSQIAIADGFAVALYVFVVVAGVAAVVWSRRSAVSPRRAVAEGARFPDDVAGAFVVNGPAAAVSAGGVAASAAGSAAPTSPLDIPPVVICRDDGVFSAEGTMLPAISHRKVAWTEIDMYTYWSARGVADFSVQVQPPPVWPARALSSGA